MTAFCPNCWIEVSFEASDCTRCGCHFGDFSQLPYEHKLIQALSHPIPETRLLAIQLLGDLRNELAVHEFADMLRRTKDFVEIREIARSLNEIGGPEALELVEGLKHHPSVLVRRSIAYIRSGRVETDAIALYSSTDGGD